MKNKTTRILILTLALSLRLSAADSSGTFAGDIAALLNLKNSPDATPLIAANLSNATFKPGSWSWRDGVLIPNGQDTLITKAKYGDFRLSLEFRCDKNASNSGIFLRCSNLRNIRENSLLVNILQGAPKDGVDRHFTGALFDCAAPLRLIKPEPGQWYQLQISAIDSRLVVLIDGKPLVQANLDDWTTTGENPDGSPNRYKNAIANFAHYGPIALSRDPGVNFRNLIIEPLQSEASLALAQAASATNSARWPEEKANAWYASQPWPVGVNYVAATAINQIEMWQASSFDPKTIDREMALVEGLGMNTVRVFLHDLVWQDDPAGFKRRFKRFLDICDKHHLKVIVTFFTNGGKPTQPEARIGKQPKPIQGVHNSGWLQSPKAEVTNDPSKWKPLENYVKDFLSSFKDDNRILMWCLYNEPQNANRGADSMNLLRAVFKWARDINPSQPLTSPVWPGLEAFDVICFVLENSDVITFHCYKKPDETRDVINRFRRFNRPVICQEYMGRPVSTFEEIMPILKNENIGAISWGLSNGKCNFHVHWRSKAGDPEPDVWFHDIFRLDGTPHSEKEIQFIKQMTGKNK